MTPTRSSHRGGLEFHTTRLALIDADIQWLRELQGQWDDHFKLPPTKARRAPFVPSGKASIPSTFSRPFSSSSRSRLRRSSAPSSPSGSSIRQPSVAPISNHSAPPHVLTTEAPHRRSPPRRSRRRRRTRRSRSADHLSIPSSRAPIVRSPKKSAMWDHLVPRDSLHRPRVKSSPTRPRASPSRHRQDLRPRLLTPKYDLYTGRRLRKGESPSSSPYSSSSPSRGLFNSTAPARSTTTPTRSRSEPSPSPDPHSFTTNLQNAVSKRVLLLGADGRAVKRRGRRRPRNGRRKRRIGPKKAPRPPSDGMRPTDSPVFRRWRPKGNSTRTKPKRVMKKSEGNDDVIQVTLDREDFKEEEETQPLVSSSHSQEQQLTLSVTLPPLRSVSPLPPAPPPPSPRPHTAPPRRDTGGFGFDDEDALVPGVVEDEDDMLVEGVFDTGHGHGRVDSIDEEEEEEYEEEEEEEVQGEEIEESNDDEEEEGEDEEIENPLALASSSSSSTSSSSPPRPSLFAFCDPDEIIHDREEESKPHHSSPPPPALSLFLDQDIDDDDDYQRQQQQQHSSSSSETTLLRTKSSVASLQHSHHHLEVISDDSPPSPISRISSPARRRRRRRRKKKRSGRRSRGNGSGNVRRPTGGQNRRIAPIEERRKNVTQDRKRLMRSRSAPSLSAWGASQVGLLADRKMRNKKPLNANIRSFRKNRVDLFLEHAEAIDAWASKLKAMGKVALRKRSLAGD